jgi:hypothetical protein
VLSLMRRTEGRPWPPLGHWFVVSGMIFAVLFDVTDTNPFACATDWLT